MLVLLRLPLRLLPLLSLRSWVQSRLFVLQVAVLMLAVVGAGNGVVDVGQKEDEGAVAGEESRGVSGGLVGGARALACWKLLLS